MQQENNSQVNNEQINNTYEQQQQQTGSCPFRQNFSRNPYYQSPNNNDSQFDMPFPRNQAMNNPYIAAKNPMNTPSSSGDYLGDYVKGALIGAAVTYLLSNEKVQNAFFKTAAKTSSMFQMGMEEVKERFEDAKAEVATENMQS